MRQKTFLGTLIKWILIIFFVGIILIARYAGKETEESRDRVKDLQSKAIEYNGVRYYIDEEDSFAIVVGLVNDKFTKVDIEVAVSGCLVTEIYERAFEECSYLEEVYIPNSIFEIGEYAFSDCIRLTKVNIPEHLSEIKRYTFYNTKIEEITIPESVGSIGENAFCSSGLKSVTIPGNVKEIGGYAFSSISSLKEVTIEDGVESIGNSAFAWNMYLSSINLPDSIETLGDSVLAGSCLKKVRIPAKIMYVQDNVFDRIDELEVIEMPEDCLILPGEGDKAVPIHAEIRYY